MVLWEEIFPQQTFFFSPLHLGELHWLVGLKFAKTSFSSSSTLFTFRDQKYIVSRQFSYSSKAGCFSLKVRWISVVAIASFSHCWHQKKTSHFFSHCDVSTTGFGRYLVLDLLSCHGVVLFFLLIRWMLNLIKLFSIVIEK